MMLRNRFKHHSLWHSILLKKAFCRFLSPLQTNPSMQIDPETFDRETSVAWHQPHDPEVVWILQWMILLQIEYKA
jgi:hypothetical protein